MENNLSCNDAHYTISKVMRKICGNNVEICNVSYDICLITVRINKFNRIPRSVGAKFKNSESIGLRSIFYFQISINFETAYYIQSVHDMHQLFSKEQLKHVYWVASVS